MLHSERARPEIAATLMALKMWGPKCGYDCITGESSSNATGLPIPRSLAL
jgi:hypothetical protein